MYESSDYDLLNDPNHPNYANFSSMSTVRKKYCSMVYTMDKNIGLLMDRLKDPNNDGNNDANLTLISDYVDFIIDYITDENSIFETDWKEPKNESDFIAKLETVLELVLAAEQAQDPEWAALLYVEALGVVENQLIIRTDGFHGGPLDDDWIIIEEAQDIVYEDLDTLREYLWLITR